MKTVPITDLQTLTSILQTSLTPAFLLVALGALLNLFTGRLSRIVDRARDLQDKHPETLGVQRAHLVEELRLLEKRMRGVGASIMLAVLAAVMVCLVIGMLFLMGLGRFSMAWLAVTFFGTGLTLMVCSLLLFVREVRLSMHAIHVRDEFLKLPEEN